MAAGWTYAEALADLDGRINLEATIAGRASAPTLERIAALTGAMGEPQRACPVVHVTGTNGKGSTAAMVTALLAGRGLTVGTYTSPDLVRVNERIARNGEPIADEELAEALQAVAALEPVVGVRATRFELLTAAAYRWFADQAVDAAVIEVGLGGRWDATNVADATVAVVTNVAEDHAELLGPTLVDIAGEKAGIVKPGSHLVLGVTDPVVAAPFHAAGPAETWLRGTDFGAEEVAVAHGGRSADLVTPAARYEQVYLPVYGAHQAANAAMAAAAAEAFFGTPIDDDDLRRALSGLRLPGRLEVVGRQPLVVLDGAHNPAGAATAAAALADDFVAISSRLLVVGLLRGRDPVEMLEPLLGAAGGATRLVVACEPPSPRALPAEEVAAAARSLGVAADEAPSPAAALQAALTAAREDELVLVTGSLYLVGAIRALLAGTN